MLELKLPLPSLFTKVLGVLFAVADAISAAIFTIVAALTPPILPDEAITLELTKAAVATSVPLASAAGVGAVTDPVNEGDDIVGDTIVLEVKVSVPDKVARVPVVGKVIFVTSVLTNVVLKLPEVLNALAVVILPPKVIVLPVLTTPVPPNCPVIAEAKGAVPSNGLPYILLGVCNCVVVLALPDKFPVTLPVTLPVKAAVTVLALKLPAPSLFTNVFAVLLEVAASIASEINLIVEELTPPILLDELEILATTNAAVATSVPVASAAGVGAVTVPVNEGDEIVGDTIVDDTIVLDVNVSVPDKVASVPVVGKVTFVSPKLVNVVLKVPAVVNALAVVILPPKVIVLPVLTTPVPPYCPVIAEAKGAVPSNGLPYILLGVANCVDVLALPANEAVIMLALKSPVPSLLTIVLGILVDVAEATAAAIFAIVEALTPPILPDEAIILELTKAAVATCVLLDSSAGVGAVGLPVKEGETIIGDTIVLAVNVSVPAKVAMVPVVGKVIFVSPTLVKVVLKVPAVANALAVVILPPKVIVLPALFTPVPPN